MDETTFNQAVLITAAFIQNGDIRICGNFREDSTAMAQVHDLLTTTYSTLLKARDLVRDRDDH